MRERLGEPEDTLLNMLLAGEHPTLGTLRAQLEASAVTGREYSGVGTFTFFAVPDQLPRVSPPNLSLGDVYFELAGTDNGGSAILFVRDGCLDMLECYTFTDAWPSSPRVTTTRYLREVAQGAASDGTSYTMVQCDRRDGPTVARALAGR